MTRQNQLIIFARAPQYGSVKQRLARDIGKTAALEFYRHTLQGLLRKMHDNPHWSLTIAVASEGATAHSLFNGFNVITQPAGDLGVRMAKVLDQFTDQHRIIIGSDIPHIEPVYIEHAFSRLAQHNVVFGPAVDGGFWLIGCQAGSAAQQQMECRPRLATEYTTTQSFVRQGFMQQGFMQPVRWSTEHALSDTIATLPAHCTYTTVQTLADVDDGASYQAFLQHPDSQKDLHCYPSYRCNSVTVR